MVFKKEIGDKIVKKPKTKRATKKVVASDVESVSEEVMKSHTKLFRLLNFFIGTTEEKEKTTDS